MVLIFITFLRNSDPLTTVLSEVTPTSSVMEETSSVSSLVTDVTITTSSSEASSITNSIATSPSLVSNDTNVTSLAGNSDVVLHSTSLTIQQHKDDIATMDGPPPSLTNQSDGSHDINPMKNNNSNNSVNITEGSGDTVMSLPINSSDNTSQVNNTEEYYDNSNGEDETFTDSLPTHQPPSPITGQQQQKSSVLIRLSNRIKELEVNMSLFGDYLERVRTRCVIM